MRTTRLLFGAALVAACLFALAPLARAAATITIINLDGAGEGFNDPTPAAPVGGNTGVTIGQQRLIVFQTAASIWGATLTSSVPINVQAAFNPLTCNATSAVLGSAGAINVVRDFPGAEVAATWYHVALGNKLSGTDQVPANNDINAQFNSNLGQAGCLTGIPFYYGLDHNEGNAVDLLAVVLHELGHGLGFSTFTNGSTGALLGGFHDVYERHLLDNSTGLHWDAMNDGQRAASAINWGNVVWDGPAVTARTASFLAPRREVVVLSPPGIAGSYNSGSATFGAAPTATGVTANVVLAVDGSAPTSDGCSALTNGAAVAGKICLIDRGTCGFNVKALAAQNAGAIGVIIANNVAGPANDLGGTDPSVTIPVFSVSLADANLIKAQLGAGVNATLRVNNGRLQGADNSNRALVYTPNPFQSGSSVSHFDTSTFPNTLMEPAINSDLTGIDLTRYQFEDIGWFPHTTAVGGPQPTLPRLSTASPNPFTSVARIDFTLERPVSVDLDVYDLGGRRVKRLVHAVTAQGDRSASWDGTDESGRRQEPGIYLYRLRAGDRLESRHLVLVR